MDRIDDRAAKGLAGTVDSIGYRVAEIERHLHSGARWFESATDASLPTHAAARMGTTGAGGRAFRLDGGDNTWGEWVQILGSADTPVKAGRAYFDPHQLIIEGTENASTYVIQIARGASGAAGLAADTYTETVYCATGQKDAGVIMLQTGRAPAGSLLWARCVSLGDNTGWIDIYFGLHEYEG